MQAISDRVQITDDDVEAGACAILSHGGDGARALADAGVEVTAGDLPIELRRYLLAMCREDPLRAASDLVALGILAGRQAAQREFDREDRSVETA